MSLGLLVVAMWWARAPSFSNNFFPSFPLRLDRCATLKRIHVAFPSRDFRTRFFFAFFPYLFRRAKFADLVVIVEDISRPLPFPNDTTFPFLCWPETFRGRPLKPIVSDFPYDSLSNGICLFSNPFPEASLFFRMSHPFLPICDLTSCKHPFR